MPKPIECAQALIPVIQTLGALPLFECGVPGFSAAEMAAPGLVFTGEAGDPWRWRMELADVPGIVYCKMLGGRAGFMTDDMFARLSAARREGLTFEERYLEGTVPRKQKAIMDTLAGGPMLSCSLKRAAGFSKEGLRGFEGALSALERMGDVLHAGFERRVSRAGVPYGWNVGVIDLPARRLGEALVARYDEIKPDALYRGLASDIVSALPGAPEAAVRALLEG